MVPVRESCWRPGQVFLLSLIPLVKPRFQFPKREKYSAFHFVNLRVVAMDTERTVNSTYGSKPSDAGVELFKTAKKNKIENGDYWW